MAFKLGATSESEAIINYHDCLVNLAVPIGGRMGREKYYGFLRRRNYLAAKHGRKLEIIHARTAAKNEKTRRIYLANPLLRVVAEGAIPPKEIKTILRKCVRSGRA